MVTEDAPVFVALCDVAPAAEHRKRTLHLGPPPSFAVTQLCRFKPAFKINCNAQVCIGCRV